MARSKQPLWWQIFITEYLKNGQNGTDAYLKARPKTSKNAARANAQRLLANDAFILLLEKSQVKVIEKTEMSRERWIELLADVAGSDIRDFLRTDSRGDVHLVDDWKDRAGGHVINSISITTTETEHGGSRRVLINRESKLKALEIMGKSLGYLTDKVEHSGSVSIVVEDPYAEPKG